MWYRAKKWAIVLSAAVVLASAGEGRGQFVFKTIPSAQQMNPVNPYYLVAPGLSQQQYLYNIQQYAKVAQQIPPWLYGYNPYPPVVVQPYVPPYPYPTPYPTPYPYPPLYNGSNPYQPTTLNPYSQSSLSNPYLSTPGYSSAINPYLPYMNPYGGFLFGEADVMRAYGSLLNSNEQARLLREQYYQSKIDTAKKKFDFEMYVKANTPTFAQEQAKIAKNTLKRIQENSNPAEIASGKSQNFLLQDLAKFPKRDVNLDVPLDETVLKHLNVTKTFGNLGVLRDGKIDWPAGVLAVLNEQELKMFDMRAQVILDQAGKGKIEVNLLAEQRKEVEKIRDRLFKKMNEIPTAQYMDGKRFLADLDDANTAVEKGDVPAVIQFRKEIADQKLKNIHDLAKYMIDKGLKFAPAVAGDEAAYQALHAALVALDVTVNAQLAKE